MNSKKISALTMLLFFIIMLILAVSAKRLHISSLPIVEVGYLEQRAFVLAKQQPEEDLVHSKKYQIAIPKTVFDNQPVYRISFEIINKEERAIARIISNIKIGEQNEDYYEVTEGITSLDLIVLSSQEKLYDGCEVYISNEIEKKY